MNKLPLEKRVAILKALAEGCSMRSTSRMVGVSINTVVKMLIDVGTACAKYQHDKLRGLSCRRLQLDEIWAFCYSKQKNVPEEHQGELGYGDVWTWTAICAETKIVPCWLLGWRDACHATAFVDDLAERLTHRVQITTDGLKAYVDAIDAAFGGQVDYAMLINAAASLHATDECFFKKAGEHGTRRGHVFHGVQFRAAPPDVDRAG